MSILKSLENLSVSEECFDEIMDIVEELLSEGDNIYRPGTYKKDEYSFIATGRGKDNGNLYKVHTKHDKGVTKSKLYAESPEAAKSFVQKLYGGPDSAHEIVEELKHAGVILPHRV